jgi:hypothetical protein
LAGSCKTIQELPFCTSELSPSHLCLLCSCAEESLEATHTTFADLAQRPHNPSYEQGLQRFNHYFGDRDLAVVIDAVCVLRVTTNETEELKVRSCTPTLEPFTSHNPQPCTSQSLTLQPRTLSRLAACNLTTHGSDLTTHATSRVDEYSNFGNCCSLYVTIKDFPVKLISIWMTGIHSN